MKIEWNKVTWYSKLVAVVLFVAVFILGFYFGAAYNSAANPEQSAAGASFNWRAHRGGLRTQRATATTTVAVPAATSNKVNTVVTPTTPVIVHPIVVATTTFVGTPPIPPIPTSPPTQTPSPPIVVPPPTSTPPPPVVSGTQFLAYTTAYGWPDNTPPGGAISYSIKHQTAGGTGTYDDPITIAVGHSITNGIDTPDYAPGTVFYLPNLRRYFIVEDTCGDGNAPQNGPCHSGYQGHPWLDLWVGGEGASKTSVFACEDAVTDIHIMIQNPSANYAVVPGPIFNGSCATQYGDTIVTQ